jgi:hypothetical protein
MACVHFHPSKGRPEKGRPETMRLGSGVEESKIGLRGSERHLTACHDELQMLFTQGGDSRWTQIKMEKGPSIIFVYFFKKLNDFPKKQTRTSKMSISRFTDKFSVKPSVIEQLHRKLWCDTNKSKISRQNQKLGCFSLRSNFAVTFSMVQYTLYYFYLQWCRRTGSYIPICAATFSSSFARPVSKHFINRTFRMCERACCRNGMHCCTDCSTTAPINRTRFL